LDQHFAAARGIGAMPFFSDFHDHDARPPDLQSCWDCREAVEAWVLSK
jgi:hypothetical protein